MGMTGNRWSAFSRLTYSSIPNSIHIRSIPFLALRLKPAGESPDSLSGNRFPFG